MAAFQDEISQYRATLLELEQKMQGEFDKAVMALSGGALGLSFTFLKEVVKSTPLKSTSWLLTAWICWGLSLSCVLFSFFSSALALRKAIKQTDAKLIYVEAEGGIFNKITVWLNPLQHGLNGNIQARPGANQAGLGSAASSSVSFSSQIMPFSYFFRAALSSAVRLDG
jgi:hypothetical protein